MFERTHGRKPTKVRPKSIKSWALTDKTSISMKHNIIFVWAVRAAVNYARSIKTLRSYCADVIHNYVTVFPSETCLFLWLCLCLCLCLFPLLEMGLACNKEESLGGEDKTWTQAPWALYMDPVEKEGPCFVLTPLKVHYGQHDH